jgi:hypothetical protein
MRMLVGALLLAAGPIAGQAIVGPHANFLYFRFATHTSLAMYAAYGEGNNLLVAGMIQNPRSGYHEIDGAVGRVVSVGSHFSGVLAVGVTSASDSWYAPVYFLPTVTFGRVTLNGSLEYYQPLQHVGARQFDLTPLTLMARTVFYFEVGGAYLLYTQVASVPTWEAGPAARMAIPNGTLQLEWMLRPRSGATDLRLTFQSN